jgi:PAS domain S-box-containing protein
MSTSNPFNRPLRILHLEDNADDRELIHAALRAAGLPCAPRVATSRAEFEAALREGEYDLIISDFTLPSYDGAAALALARQARPNTPFIFVSGTIGEERAVESLKNGATDYVLKGNLARLGPAVERALREAEERVKRKQAEAALRESEERFREMAATLRDVFWVTSPNGWKLHYVSPAYAQIWGRPIAELFVNSTSWLEAVLPEDSEKVRAALARLKEGGEYAIEYRISRPDGTVRWIEDRGYPVRGPSGRVDRVIGVATDITERKQLTAQLLQAQKMEAIGRLAGGVAHDFNNTLTVINGYTKLLLDTGALPAKAAEQLRLVYTAGMRAGNLTRQLLLFSRKHTTNKQVIDLNEHIRELARMFGRILGEPVRLELDLAPELKALHADSGMIEQILMNLAVNARDAMPQGGRLTLATSAVRFTEEDVDGRSGRRAGEFVCLRVSDTGCGIPPEIMPRIFEPFYTTKAPGVGTGLGLATVFGIVQEHEGWLEVDSTVGVGTTFRLYFPPSTEQPAAAKGQTAEPFTQKGTETILLVEDETPVRDFTAAVLEHYGYRVLQAETGKDALEVWKWHAERIALLLTDMVMPDGISGMDLARELRKEKPPMPVILMSGYTSETVGKLIAQSPRTRFIQKPFPPSALTKVLRELLDEPLASPALAPPAPVPEGQP